MKLLIDIGNTNTAIAIAKGKKLLKRYFIHTSKERISAKSFKRLLAGYLSDADKIVIVSVVPEFLAVMKKVFKKITPHVPVLVVGKDIKVPIKNLYKKPKEVGQDRLVTSFAAAGVCGTPVLSIDFGTAVTMDYVNEKGEYAGGIIFPGLRLALGSLVKGTALLPKVEIKLAKGFIGRDTAGSMNNGILFGYAAMCDGLIERFRKKCGRQLKIIATGGDAGIVAKYSRHIKTVRPGLIFEGLKRLL